jgi:hypothetical protein
LFFVRCTQSNVQITTEFILNNHWSKGKNGKEANSIEIIKMRVKKDSALDAFAKPDQTELLKKLEYDSNFHYYARVFSKPGESYETKKIYFNRDNGFYWTTSDYSQKVKTIGDLQTNSWYEISGLTYYYYIVYVDSVNKVHPYTINTATNY